LEFNICGIDIWGMKNAERTIYLDTFGNLIFGMKNAESDL
jgi:hypothetical protein